MICGLDRKSKIIATECALARVAEIFTSFTLLNYLSLSQRFCSVICDERLKFDQ